MADLIRATSHKANKDHPCSACEWFGQSNFGQSDVTADEWQEIKSAEADGWKVKRGMQYIRQAVKHDGEVCVLKFRPEIHAICLKYDLYPED